MPELLRDRKPITACRDALNGYQKGKCFYCFADISVEARSAFLGDVDHFFPPVLGRQGVMFLVDGVWNLVLACAGCNRGPSGKFERVPGLRYLDRLHRRNEHLIQSHHPLRETLMGQAGSNEVARRKFLQAAYDTSVKSLIHTWSPAFEHAPAF